MAPLNIHLVVKDLWQRTHCDPKLFDNINTSEFKPDANQMRKDFVYTEI
jgi:hypothetical protein